jgi:tetratricopeptide (TPR) repeat protein
MSSRARLLTVLVCLGFALPVFSGEPQWVEIHSPHFSVVTDAGEKRGRDVAVRFEQMRAVFGSLMVKAKVNTPIPLQIIAFRNGKELRQFTPIWQGKSTDLAGLFQSGSDRCFIMLDMSVENPWQVVFHEYAHQLMNGTLPVQLDPWFEEGFAEYFRSIVVADVHLHSPDYQETAGQEFEAVLKIDPNNAAALRGLGYSYLMKQDFEKAGEYLHKSAKLNPSDPRVLYYSALLYQREASAAFGSNTERLESMQSELERSVKLDPDFADAYSVLAFTYMSQGKRDQALALC